MRVTYTCRHCGGEFLVHHCAEEEVARLREELAEARNAILREGLMVEELKEQLADYKAKL